VGGRDFEGRKTNRVSNLENGRERKGLCCEVGLEGNNFSKRRDT
jgi:hypothetical protein